MKRFHSIILCLLCIVLAVSTACQDNNLPDEDPNEIPGSKEPGEEPGKNPDISGTCPERVFLEHFGKEQLMVGAMAEDPFFQQNPDLMDVRYIYLADAIFRGPAVPSQYNEADSRWWGWWQDHRQPPGQYLVAP